MRSTQIPFRPVALSLIASSLFAGLGVCSTLRAQPASEGSAWVIEHVNVIPMTHDTLLHNQQVLIQGEIIMDIRPQEHAVIPSGARRIDGRGKFLIPGFSEMHYHWRNDEGGIERDFGLLLSYGITTARNMAEYDWQDQIDIRTRIRNGSLLGPEYYTTGPYLKAADLPDSTAVKTQVHRHASRGYDFIKLADNLPQPLYEFLLAEAKAVGIPVIGHAQRHLPLEESLRMKSIEHAEEFVYLFSEDQWADPGFLEASLQQLQSSGVVVTPTLVVFEDILRYMDDTAFALLPQAEEGKYMLPGDYAYWTSEDNSYRRDLKGRIIQGKPALELLQGFFERMQSYTRQMAAAGIPLMTGSDTFGFTVPGHSLHREFELLAACGMAPYDILKATTAVPARYLGADAQWGTVTSGQRANVVLLGANPLEDIGNTRAVEGVFLRGQWLEPETLNSLRDQARRIP